MHLINSKGSGVRPHCFPVCRLLHNDLIPSKAASVFPMQLVTFSKMNSWSTSTYDEVNCVLLSCIILKYKYILAFRISPYICCKSAGSEISLAAQWQAVAAMLQAVAPSFKACSAVVEKQLVEDVLFADTLHVPLRLAASQVLALLPQTIGAHLNWMHDQSNQHCMQSFILSAFLQEQDFNSL